MLKIRNLNIVFPNQDQAAVQNVSLDMRSGEIVGLVGESGSGKSLTSLAIAGLLPETAEVSGSVEVYTEDGQCVDVLTADTEHVMCLRSREISMVFQEPMTALNPVVRVGAQVVEAVEMSGRAVPNVYEHVVDLFRDVQLPNAEVIGEKYPHQLSGGQKQRVMIAMALASQPRLILADEPTTALDVTVQKSILQILKSLVAKHNVSVLFVSHDLGVIAELCDSVYVMRKGEIVESGHTKELLQHPTHPYTKGLLACRPSITQSVHRLPTLNDALAFEESYGQAEKPLSTRQSLEDVEPVLAIDRLCVSYQQPGSVFWRKREIPAVKDVSLQVAKGEIHGVVGESGCGKTTVGKAIVGLLPYGSGSIRVAGREVREHLQTDAQQYRKKVQLIFQDPYGSLNPRLTIGECLYEVARVHNVAQEKRDAVIKDILEVTGMPISALAKYPFQFSGGQRQRICIARSLIVEPELLICDESVSALDVSVQAQVLNVLKDLRDDLGVSLLFITHDLSVVRFMCDNVTVMNAGLVEESGSVQQVLDHPKQHYTQQLIAAVPRIEF